MTEYTNSKSKIEHRDLTIKERKDFINLYHMVEANDKPTQLIKRFPLILSIFPLSYLVYLIVGIINQKSLIVTSLGIIFGLATLQMLFILTHMWGHSLMFLYEAWKPNNPITSNLSTVTFYAFYHHHHTKTDDWAPELSYYNSEGSRRIVQSHWVSYSLLCAFEFKLIIPMIISIWYLPSIMAPYIFGYEIGTFLLPFAHDWVHMKNS